MHSTVVSETFMYVASPGLHMSRYVKHDIECPSVSFSPRNALQTYGTDETIVSKETVLRAKANPLDGLLLSVPKAPGLHQER